MVIDKRKMQGVQEAVLRYLATRKEFETVEVIFGLAELSARLIAKNLQGTSVQKGEVMEKVAEHMALTVRIGCGEESAQQAPVTLN